jgi:hypothetical protein
VVKRHHILLEKLSLERFTSQIQTQERLSTESIMLIFQLTTIRTKNTQLLCGSIGGEILLFINHTLKLDKEKE